MEPEVFASSLCISLVFLVLLAWKWRLDMKVVIPGAIAFGLLAGVIVGLIDSMLRDLSVAAMIPIELFFVFLMALIVILIRFYRDPDRIPPETENVILSPADGKIIYIKEVKEGSSLVSTKGERQFELNEITATDILGNVSYLVGIEMNIMNVHVNRSPLEGKIILQKRVCGKFISLRRQESEILNERVTTVVDNGLFRIAVVQIASRLVRRIVSYVAEGDTVAIGQRIGIIKFGSQVDLVLPRMERLSINVRGGDQVIAGVSVIARYR